MRAVVNDPKVLSILEKPRTDKSYRFHQGDRLRMLLCSLKQNMVLLVTILSSDLCNLRRKFGFSMAN
jgi:hypothetical protein